MLSMQQRLARDFGQPVYTCMVGPARAQIHKWEGRYHIFLVYNNMASSLGASTSLKACKNKIEELKDRAEGNLSDDQMAMLQDSTSPESTQGMVSLNNCPRCGGAPFEDAERSGSCVRCLQCGYEFTEAKESGAKRSWPEWTLRAF